MITLVIDHEAKIDTYFLNVSTVGIRIPLNVSMQSIYASLRMKHDVLILTENTTPEVDLKKRFSFGEQFIHLSPRFLSYLTDNFSRQSVDFQEFKSFLMCTK